MCGGSCRPPRPRRLPARPPLLRSRRAWWPNWRSSAKGRRRQTQQHKVRVTCALLAFVCVVFALGCQLSPAPLPRAGGQVELLNLRRSVLQSPREGRPTSRERGWTLRLPARVPKGQGKLRKRGSSDARC